MQYNSYEESIHFDSINEDDAEIVGLYEAVLECDERNIRNVKRKINQQMADCKRCNRNYMTGE